MSVSTANKILRGDLCPEAGGPLRPPRPRLRPGADADEVAPAARERLDLRSSEAPNGCRLMTEGVRSLGGYAVIRIQNKHYMAHRLAYELANGPIPDGLEIDHACHSSDVACCAGNDCPHRRCIR